MFENWRRSTRFQAEMAVLGQLELRYGQWIDAQTICRLAKMPPKRAFPALERLVKQGILEATDQRVRRELRPTRFYRSNSEPNEAST